MRDFSLRPGLKRLFRIRPERLPAIHTDADDELRALIDARIDHLVARGVAPEAARAEALRRLGADVDDVRATLHTSAEHRERRMRLSEHVETFIQDLKYAARGLARRPAFTAIAVLTLAIGIGATTAIFSAVNVLLLRPLPFANPNELLSLSLTTPDNAGRQGNDHMVWSYPKYLVLRGAQHSFSFLAAYEPAQVTFTTGDPELVKGEDVGATYLRTLGILPVRGRDFDVSVDASPGAAKQIILAYGLWQRRYNLDPSMIGKTVDVNREPYTIVGVTPNGFRGATGQADFFIPITVRPAPDLAETMSHEFFVVGRLKPGIAMERAASEVAAIGKRINDMYADNLVGKKPWGATARPMDSGRVAQTVKRSILILFGAVVFVLLIACVNVANLLLGRASARRREIAVRLAIGAGRGRLVRLMLTESVLLSSIGAAASLIVAWISIHALRNVSPATLRLPRGADTGVVSFSSISLDWTALAFTVTIALLVGIAFGFAPALNATRASLADAIKQGDRQINATNRRRFRTGRGMLVVVEVALAIVLLAGSGLMLRSLAKLLATDPGFDPERMLTFRLTIPPGALARDSMPGFYTQILERLQALPGVTNAAITDCAPLGGGCNGTLLEFKDRPTMDESHWPLVGVMWATPGWFATARIPLERGRLFTAADRVGMPKVVLVNEAAARAFWPNENPIGKRVGIGQGGFGAGAEVIGVVGDVRQWADSLGKPGVYLPYAQSPSSRMIIFLRSTGSPAALGAAARATVHDLAPQYPVYDMQTMSDRIRAATAPSRFSATLLGFFAFTALTLAAIGIYGVMSLAVAARTREIGIRIALGADRHRVQRLIVGEGLALASAGAVIGIVGALAATRVLQSFLFDTRSSDPSVYIGVLALLGGVAVAASWLPARRAALVDPLTALRSD